MTSVLSRLLWWMILCFGCAVATAQEFEVTAFGTGANRAQAVAAARQQSLADAISSVSGGHSDARERVEPRVLHTKVISAYRIDDGQFEAQVESLIQISKVGLPARPTQGVAVLPDYDHSGDANTLELVQAVRERLSRHGITPVDSDHPSVPRALRRLHFPVLQSNATSAKATTQSSLPADVLCLLSAESVQIVGLKYRITAHVVLLQAFGSNRHQISTVRATVTGDEKGGQKAAQIEAAIQISKLAASFAAKYANSQPGNTASEVSPERIRRPVNHGIILESDW